MIFFFLAIGTRWSDHTDSLRVGLRGVTIGLVVWAAGVFCKGVLTGGEKKNQRKNGPAFANYYCRGNDRIFDFVSAMG